MKRDNNQAIKMMKLELRALAKCTSTHMEEKVRTMSVNNEESEHFPGDQNFHGEHEFSDEIEEQFQNLRTTDFSRLDEQHCIYLDYTGSGIAPKSLVDEHARVLKDHVFGNPHSESCPSRLSSELDLEARKKVLEFCNAEPSEYVVIWTPNASGALKLLGESYPFTSSGAFLHGPDCHNSVVGIAEFAKAKKAKTAGFGFLGDSMCYDWSDFVQRIKTLSCKTPNGGRCLLAFPAESNASGLKHNVHRYVEYAHGRGWDVCVDAAAYAPTNVVDFVQMGKPEFVSMSFYKIFGYPTGIGCLVAKRSALKRLQKPWFAGGTVAFAWASREKEVAFLLDDDNPAKFEDGTINFQNAVAVTKGIEYMQNIGMENLCRHVTCLSAYAERELRHLTWNNGAPLVYIPAIVSDDEKPGHALTMVFLNSNWKAIPLCIIQDIVTKKGIAVRAGCFCNPSSGFQMVNKYADLPAKDYDFFLHKFLKNIEIFKDEKEVYRFFKVFEKYGMLRISFGPASNKSDVDFFLACIKRDILDDVKDVNQRIELFRRDYSFPNEKALKEIYVNARKRQRLVRNPFKINFRKPEFEIFTNQLNKYHRGKCLMHESTSVASAESHDGSRKQFTGEASKPLQQDSFSI